MPSSAIGVPRTFFLEKSEETPQHGTLNAIQDATLPSPDAFDTVIGGIENEDSGGSALESR